MYKDGRKIPLELGIRLSVDDMYAYHRELKDKFQYVYVDVSHLKTLEQEQFYTRFVKTYKLIIASPMYVNAYDRMDNSFSKSIYYAQQVLDLSQGQVWGYVTNLDRFYNIQKEVAYNTVENVYLRRVLPIYQRIGLNLIVEHVHKGPLTSDVFPLSYGLKLNRSNKGLGLALDSLSAYLMGARLLLDANQLAVSSLSKDYKILELSGIGKKGKGTSIRTCTYKKSGEYIEFVKLFKRSIIVLSPGDTESALGDWEYIEKYLGYKNR